VARQPVEEHRVPVVGEQADERQLGARRALQDHHAVAGEHRGDELAAELARVALDRERLVALEHDLARGLVVPQLLFLRVVAAGFHGGAVVLPFTLQRNHPEETENENPHRYWPVTAARVRISPNRLSV